MKPEYTQWHKILSLAVKQKKMYSVYVNNGLNFDETDEHIWTFVREEIKKMYPETHMDIRSNLIVGGLFSFQTEEECYRFYKIFEQPLTDSSAIYACTFAATGECETENT